MISLGLDHSYARDLPGASVSCKPAGAPSPQLHFLNRSLADELRLDLTRLPDAQWAALFAGNALPTDAQPVAQAYAGHQFGGFSPQLGDGRALLLGEIVDTRGARRDIAFKGSGRTPFSRGGDGKATLGPMLREVLIGEAMHALGIPTTRALAVVATGEPVHRDRELPGAVLTRVAASHIRVGTLQYFAARGDLDGLRRLLDYTITRHYPELRGAAEPAMALLGAVARRQASLIAQWMNVGFIHGVMNTDNMTLSGETIDYGPCAFMEHYDPAAVFSSIDHGGRYAYGNQPHIARWNLARLAESLLPLAADADDEAAVRHAVATATDVIDAFPQWYGQHLLEGQRRKLGLFDAAATDDAVDQSLVADWLDLLHTQGADFTLAWRGLADAIGGAEDPLRSAIVDTAALDAWLARWRSRLAADAATNGLSMSDRAARMRQASPWIIPRNHRVEEVLVAATEEGRLEPFERLLTALRRPFDSDAEFEPFARPAPRTVTAGYRTFCGT